MVNRASLVAQTVKNLPAMWETGFNPWVGKNPGGHDNPLQDSCLENPHGQRSLAGYSPWSRRVGHDWVTKHSTSYLVYNSYTSIKKKCQDLSNAITLSNYCDAIHYAVTLWGKCFPPALDGILGNKATSIIDRKTLWALSLLLLLSHFSRVWLCATP